MAKIIILSFFCILLLSSCNSGSSQGNDKPKTKNVTIAHVAKPEGCTVEEVVRKLSELEEIKEQKAVLDSLFSDKPNISFMVDSADINGKQVYTVTAGYNGELRYEPYYHFYINKATCGDIEVMDVVNGDYLPLEEWRKNR
ncbi:hypothetical protein ACR79M_16685 [Sphingobacterium spiritivorum]|uniref:hypothetical protein n=1 Tax=Sphingobacterium spiritivorum TaxID=258 RepID=UPI003DA23EDF